MAVFSISCCQNKTTLPTDNINSEIKYVITFHEPEKITRNIIQNRKGNSWLAAFECVFWYDGDTITDFKRKTGPQ